MSHSFFYDWKIYSTKDAAVVLKVLRQYYDFNSMLDVGCGTGTWLYVASNQLGLTDIKGVDASNYDASQFHIPPIQYQQNDLSVPLRLQRKFDLVICLEVAEHLPPKAAATLVESLISHGKVILFSAAIPGQGGQNHINEQWPVYWQALFAHHGYLAFDILRMKFWADDEIEPWYRQNMFIYAKPESLPAFEPVTEPLKPYIHPGIFSMKTEELKQFSMLRQKEVLRPDLKTGLKIFAKAILIALRLR